MPLCCILPRRGKMPRMACRKPFLFKTSWLCVRPVLLLTGLLWLKEDILPELFNISNRMTRKIGGLC